MITEPYDFIEYNHKTLFFFRSEGAKGNILKGVIFTPSGENLWNLAFGDWRKGDIDDAVISNNHDIVKTFNTIAKIVYPFSDEFPTRQILI